VLALIAFDAASLAIIDELLAEDRLPHLRALRASGTEYPLETPASHFPAGTYPTLWSGVPLEQHGIHFPFMWSAAEQRVRFLTSFPFPVTMWERLAQCGVRCVVLDAYESPVPETIDGLFAADSLSIGFARRFATYKRASLVFSDLHRLRNLLGDPARPVQILFAGKAHPADRPGQELVQHIFQLSQEDTLRGKVFFIEDYDMRVAGMLVQGVDVWLNTPRRPMEASGTSGQKAALNGALNCSVADGWWPEAYDGENGWTIGPERGHDDEAEQDREDALALYKTLEEQVVPTYYERDAEGLPRRWLRMMKRSIATVAPRFSASRMVREYAEQAYLPAAAS